MTIPFMECEEEALDVIQTQLMERKVPLVRMIKMYAEFLLASIPSEWTEQSSGSTAEVVFLIRHLKLAIASFGTDDSDNLRRPGRIELWRLYNRLEHEQPTQAALIRCAICCFYEEKRDPDREEDLTPIPFYLFLLKRFDPDIGMDFLAYARTYLLASL